ncbi:MAG: hypothetical protein D6696_06515 [Acidobacteria bacterium]|nr:MAG: hypothetical protein D6696_06515 [Acidobacteriota bacterium]
MRWWTLRLVLAAALWATAVPSPAWSQPPDEPAAGQQGEPPPGDGATGVEPAPPPAGEVAGNGGDLARDARLLGRIARLENELMALDGRVAWLKGLLLLVAVGLALVLWFGWRRLRELEALVQNTRDLVQNTRDTVFRSDSTEAPAAPSAPEYVPPPAEPPPVPAPAAPPPPPLDVGELLDELRGAAAELARGFASAEVRQRFVEDFGVAGEARLERYRQASSLDDSAVLRRQWVAPDLLNVLNLLARYYSQAEADHRHGHAPAAALAERLRALLYDRFDGACRRRGWFALDPVVPFEDVFDPRRHKGIGSRAMPGFTHRVVAVRAVGLRNAGSGELERKAEVLVGA